MSSPQEFCGRIQVCGHQCKQSCRHHCPSCEESCANRCSHGPCQSSNCGRECSRCLEPCSWICQHHECTRLCFQMCNRPRCNHPCPLKLDCGHPCIGLCGESCPKKCRFCHPQTLDAISQQTLGESEPWDTFVELDCGHIFEVSGLDRWVDGDEESVRLSTCPACRTSIQTTTLRYSNVVKRKLSQVERVKKHVLANEKMARGFYMNARSELGLASVYFLQAITLQPSLFEAHYGLSVVRCRQFKFPEAFTHLRFVVEKSRLAREIESVPLLDAGDTSSSSSSIGRSPRSRSYFRSEPGKTASEELAITALVQWASALTSLHEFTQAGQLCDIVFKYDKQHSTAREIKTRVQQELTYQVVIALRTEVPTGNWHQCPNGHLYAIGGCGVPLETSFCPDCHAPIGLDLEFDESRTASMSYKRWLCGLNCSST